MPGRPPAGVGADGRRRAARARKHRRRPGNRGQAGSLPGPRFRPPTPRAAADGARSDPGRRRLGSRPGHAGRPSLSAPYAGRRVKLQVARADRRDAQRVGGPLVAPRAGPGPRRQEPPGCALVTTRRERENSTHWRNPSAAVPCADAAESRMIDVSGASPTAGAAPSSRARARARDPGDRLLSLEHVGRSDGVDHQRCGARSPPAAQAVLQGGHGVGHVFWDFSVHSTASRGPPSSCTKRMRTRTCSRALAPPGRGSCQPMQCRTPADVSTRSPSNGALLQGLLEVCCCSGEANVALVFSLFGGRHFGERSARALPLFESR